MGCDDVVAARIAEEWQKEYGQPCPPEHAMSQAEWSQNCDHPDTWCGKCHYEGRHGGPADTGVWGVPAYSTQITDAWEVVEALGATGLYVTISKGPGMSWEVRGWEPETNRRRYIAHAKTAPLAICRAALDATPLPQMRI